MVTYNFYCIIIVRILSSLFKRKLKNVIGRKKRYRWKCAPKSYSVMQIMAAKITILRTLYIHVVLNSEMCPQILYDIVLYARHFLPVKFFSRVLHLLTMFRATAKCNMDRWITCVISTSTGIHGVRLAHHIS